MFCKHFNPVIKSCNYKVLPGGIGGCPFAPGATGNICTEDLVHMLDEIGYKHGTDLDKLIS